MEVKELAFLSYDVLLRKTEVAELKIPLLVLCLWHRNPGTKVPVLNHTFGVEIAKLKFLSYDVLLRKTRVIFLSSQSKPIFLID
jgi:hypothetical protein